MSWLAQPPVEFGGGPPSRTMPHNWMMYWSNAFHKPHRWQFGHTRRNVYARERTALPALARQSVLKLGRRNSFGKKRCPSIAQTLALSLHDGCSVFFLD